MPAIINKAARGIQQYGNLDCHRHLHGIGTQHMRTSEQFSFAGSDGVVSRSFCVAGCCVSSTVQQCMDIKMFTLYCI